MISDSARTLIPERAGIFKSSLPAPPVEPAPVVAALRHAVSDPDRPAIVDGATGERFSRAQLAERSAALAAGLAGRGIGRGDLVAIAMPNLAWWPVVALGVWRAGAVVVPVSPLWTAEEAARVLARVRPRIAVAHGPLVPVVRGALSAAGIPIEVVVHGEDDGEGEDTPCTPFGQLLDGAGGDPFAEPQLDPGELAVVPFSSGTGGLPKGVRLTHGNLSAVSAQLATALASGGAFDADSVTLAGAPFFHAMGLSLSLCAPLGMGAQIVTGPISDTGRTLELIAEHHVTHATLRPPAVAELAVHPEVERHDTSHLQFVATGGAHLPAATFLRASECLDCLVRQGYGMTESITISAPLGRPSDPETVGWLTAGTEARLVAPESGRDVAPGQSGELWIRGPQVMDGYHGDPDATAATITADGWLRTGDLVTLRDDGQLLIADRLKELIKVEGASVAPAELELVLCEHPSVRDAAAVGRPDAERGEVPVAYVVLAGPATAEGLISFVAARVARYKRLHDVRFVDELPRLPSGKLRRHALRDQERHRSDAAPARGAEQARGRGAHALTPGSPP